VTWRYFIGQKFRKKIHPQPLPIWQFPAPPSPCSETLYKKHHLMVLCFLLLLLMTLNLWCMAYLAYST
jgi:hypothetical protein